MVTKTWGMVDRLVPFQHMSRVSCSPLGATNRDGDPTNREHQDRLSLCPPHPNPRLLPPPSNRTTYCSSGVVNPPPSPFNTQSIRVPTTPAHLLFLRRKTPASHRARGGTPAVNISLGANCEGKGRVKGKASRSNSYRIGSAPVCVRRDVQHRELKLPKSTRFALITAIMVAVPTSGPNGCPVSPPPLSFQTYSHAKKPPQAMLMHPPQRERLRVLERCYEERTIISITYRGDTMGPKYNPRDSYYRRRLKTRGYIMQYSMTLKKSVTRTNSRVGS